jgi:hypothetical protein
MNPGTIVHWQLWPACCQERRLPRCIACQVITGTIQASVNPQAIRAAGTPGRPAQAGRAHRSRATHKHATSKSLTRTTKQRASSESNVQQIARYVASRATLRCIARNATLHRKPG